MDKIAIFGSGLSAGYIAAAAKVMKIPFNIYTNKLITEAPNLGHVLLREIPPTIDVQPTVVSFFSIGSKDAYLARMKRYEDRSTSKTAFPENGRSELRVYNPNIVYEKLLPAATTHLMKNFTDEEIIAASKEHLWTFVTFPLKESFSEEKIVKYWSTYPSAKNNMPNYAIYNGSIELPWTRYTCYWGTERWEFSHLEFPAEGKSPMAGAVLTADIAPGVKEYFSLYPRLTLVGRWAQWNKSILAHEAYDTAMKILQTL